MPSSRSANLDSTPGHNWSGWPGATCLKCGAEDMLETAIGLRWYDPATDAWDTEEHKAFVREWVSNCPADMGEEDKDSFVDRMAALAKKFL
jgi:hypothetical protein